MRRRPSRFRTRFAGSWMSCDASSPTSSLGAGARSSSVWASSWSRTGDAGLARPPPAPVCLAVLYDRMSLLIEVAFKGNRKEFFLWEADDSPSLKAPVIVDADRGEDLGHVYALGELAEKRSAGAAHGLGEAAPSRKVRRVASDDDVRRFAEVRAQDEDARRTAMVRVKANQLVIKITYAEWQWDPKKLT